MARKKIKRIIQSPESYGDAEKQFPTVSLRPNATNKIHNVKQNIQRRNFENEERTYKKFLYSFGYSLV